MGRHRAAHEYMGRALGGRETTSALEPGTPPNVEVDTAEPQGGPSGADADRRAATPLARDRSRPSPGSSGAVAHGQHVKGPIRWFTEFTRGAWQRLRPRRQPASTTSSSPTRSRSISGRAREDDWGRPGRVPRGPGPNGGSRRRGDAPGAYRGVGGPNSPELTPRGRHRRATAGACFFLDVGIVRAREHGRPATRSPRAGRIEVGKTSSRSGTPLPPSPSGRHLPRRGTAREQLFVMGSYGIGAPAPHAAGGRSSRPPTRQRHRPGREPGAVGTSHVVRRRAPTRLDRAQRTGWPRRSRPGCLKVLHRRPGDASTGQKLARPSCGLPAWARDDRAKSQRSESGRGSRSSGRRGRTSRRGGGGATAGHAEAGRRTVARAFGAEPSLDVPPPRRASTPPAALPEQTKERARH